MEATKSSYTGSHKKYYEANKEIILARYKENKPYKAFYERNKEKLKAKALERYYAKKLQAEESPGSPNIMPPEQTPGEAV